MSEGKKGFFGRLVEGLTKTRNNIVSGIDSIFSGFSAIDDDFYEEIEETLIMGDIGIQTTMSIVEDLRRKVKELHIKEPEECKELLINSIKDQMDLGENAYEFEHKKSVVLVIGVNGVGPKAALGILSTMTPDDLRMAIVTGDAKAISRAPGIGPKTAQRLILDLKDKISMEEMLGNLALPCDGGAAAALGTASMGEAAKEAVQALVALGYSNMEANKAVKQVEVTETMTAEDVLKASLRYLSF